MKKLLAALILLSAATNVFADSFNAISIQGQLNSADPIYDVKVHILSGGDVVGTATDIALLPDATDYVFSTNTYITNPWVFQTGAEYTIRLSTGTSPLTIISTFSITAVPFALTVRGDAQTGDQNLFGAYGNVGIGTSTPTYRLVVSSGGSNIMWVSSDGVHATKFHGDGSGLTGLVGTGDNLGNHTATTTLQMAGNDIYNASTITATGEISAARYKIGGNTVLAIGPTSSIGVGVQSGSFISGANNTSLGYISCPNGTGSHNTCIGSITAPYITSGYQNTLVGSVAGLNIRDGSWNTLVGEASGQGNGFYNTSIGYYSGDSGTNNISIGALSGIGGANNSLDIGGTLFGDLADGTIGIGVYPPTAALDILSTGTYSNQMAQIWRNSEGVVKASMSATGVLMASKFIGNGSGLSGIPGDSLGTHVATTTLNMGTFGISNAGSIVATTYYGDGSNLTGIAGGDVYKAASQTFTGQNVFTAPARFDSTMSVTANAFSVGGSTLVVSNGNVGIGVMSLGSKLHVDGDATIGAALTASSITATAVDSIQLPNSANLTLGSTWGSGALTLKNGVTTFGSLGATGISSLVGFKANDGTQYAPAYGFVEEAGVGIWRPASNTIAFGTVSTEKMRIDSYGNVGIGTASPAYPLDVNGSIRTANQLIVMGTATISNSDYPNLKIARTGGTAGTQGAMYAGFSNFGYSGGTGADTILNSDWGIGLQVNNQSGTPSTAMLITNGGNVGIGDINPAFKLSVNDGTVNVDDGYGYSFGDGSSVLYGNSSTDFMSMKTAGIDRLYVNSGGNVGIGDTAPTAKLVVNGNIVSSGTVQATKYYGDGSALSNVPALNASQTYTGANTYQSTVTIAGTLLPANFVGAFQFFISKSSVCPSGWLRADGSLKPKNAYPALFSMMDYMYGGSGDYFGLPDMNDGEFVRAVSTGTTGNFSSSQGSKQSDAFQGHWHKLYYGSGAVGGSGVPAGNAGAYTDGDRVKQAISDTVNGTPRVSAETRPRNYAMIPCIFSGVP